MRLLVALCAPGSWKFVWLSVLNASARNSIFTRSVIRIDLWRDVSQPTKLGPTNVLRPRLLTQPRHGAVKKPPPGANAPPQPFAHWSWLGVKLLDSAFGRSLAIPSRL